MKTITVKNLQIQFDSNSDKELLTIVDEIMMSINELLQNHFDEQPQIFTNSIDTKDITIKDNESLKCECNDPIFNDNICEKCGGVQYE